MTIFLYVLYHLVVITIVTLFAYKISRSKKCQYWKLAVIPIVVYAIEEGMRWGRESDWTAYYRVYEQIGLGHRQEFELLFYASWRLFSITGLPYPFMITACSCFLIFSFFYFSKDYKRYVCLIIPLLVVWVSSKSIQFVRWFMGYSVFLIGYSLFLNGKKIKGLILLISSVFFHFGLILFVVLAYAIAFVRKPIIHPLIPIVTSFLLVLTFNLEFLQFFSILSGVFLHSGTERFGNYTNDPGYWLQANFETKSTIVYILNMIPFYAYLWFFYSCLSNKKYIVCLSDKKYVIKECLLNRKLYVIYNLAIVGLIVRSISSGVEILDRYAVCFDMFFVVASVIGFDYIWKRHQPVLIRYVFMPIFILSFIIQGFKFCKPLDKEIQMHYYWEKNLPSINAVANSYH